MAFAAAEAGAQNWGEMQLIDWQDPPYSIQGFFHPFYCDTDSLLYFDTFDRAVPYYSKIYASHFDSILYDVYIWSDPIELPEPINIEGYINIMPYINPTGDTMFFCSNRPGSYGGIDIWLSVKQNNNWCEPINLGDSINTENNEYKPFLSSTLGLLFFERSDVSWHSKVYMSQRNDSIWGTPQMLPEVINVPGYFTFGTFFDENESALYFTNHDYWLQDIDLLKKSIYSNGEWGEPTALSDNINGFWYPNVCGRVSTGNAFMSRNRNLLFYEKEIWDGDCIDSYFLLYVSERTVGIHQTNIGENKNKLNIYPNPSNNVFYIIVPNQDQNNSIDIFNITGQLVKQLFLVSNNTIVIWDGTNEKGMEVSSGLYFVAFDSSNIKAVGKLLLMK